jgi:hypothetical protein
MPRGKVLILCQDGDSLPNGVFPNLRVIRIAQPDVDDVIRLVAGRREYALRPGGRCASIKIFNDQPRRGSGGPPQ